MSKSVVITGGSKGIGLELVKHYASNGFKVISGSRTKYGKFDKKIAPNIKEISIDVRNVESHELLAREAINETGKLDVYINNAGFSEWRSLASIDGEFLESMFSTNVYGYFWGTKAAANVMTSGGSILNISSLAAKRGTPNNSAYVATKFAITGLTQSSSKELGTKGIRVNAVCPVLISTPGLLQALNSSEAPSKGNTEAFLKDFSVNQTALGRLPTVNEVVDLCYFLTSENASAITGQSINIDCGVLPS
jgi:3-oxoacyl-[acyl-carrier protein] reductase/meso-butanediol dehydrogenase/(S,S)-butanediol dehydrogenase/diacetyl reductase